MEKKNRVIKNKNERFISFFSKKKNLFYVLFCLKNDQLDSELTSNRDDYFMVFLYIYVFKL